MKDKLAKVGQLYSNVDDGALTLGYRRDSFVRETVIKADKKGEVREDGFVFKVKIAAPVVLVGELRRRGARAARRHRRPGAARAERRRPQDAEPRAAACRSGSPAPRG